MSKEQSNFAHNFKRTTAGGVDTRTLRAHRRSIEWKQSRDQVVSRRRNVGENMSPVPEAKGADNKTKGTQKKSRSGDADLDKVANRKAQLMKWKEQKDLRKKVEELEKAKKKPFRVVHIEPEVVPFNNFALKPPQVAAASDTITASAKPPTTRSKTVGDEAKHDVPASRSTRSKVTLVAAGSEAGSRSTRETRSKSSSVAPKTGIAGKTQKKSDPEPKISDKAKPTKASSVKLANGIGKIELKTTAAPERATRSRSRATVVSGAKAVASSSSQIHSSSTSSFSKQTPKVFDFSYSKMKKVNLKRGSEPSFAPADFRFKAPENLKPFSFDKLNSSNEASDVERKTSAIEISADEGSFSSGGGTKAAKRQMRKSTKITSTPRVSEIQEERLRTPAVSVVPSLAIVPASDCIVLVEKLPEPMTSQPGEDDGHKGPVFSMMQSMNERSRRKSRRDLSASPVDEICDGDRSRSNLRRREDGMDDSQRDDTSPDEPQRSRHSLRKPKSKGVAKRPVLGQHVDSNDVFDFVAKTSVEKIGAGSVASKETSARGRRSAASKEVAKRIEGGGLKSTLQSEDTLTAPETSEEETKTEEVVKKSGRRERRSAVSKTDVANATESKRRSVVKLISNMSSISNGDIASAEKTAEGSNEECFTAVQEEKELERGVRTRRSTQGKVVPGVSISDSDSAAHMSKIPEDNLESELADEDEPKKVKASKNLKRKSLRNLTIAGNSMGTNSLAVAPESVSEITETSCNGDLEIVTEPGSQRAEETENKMVESKVPNASAVVFQTPSQPIRTMRSRSIALGPDSLKRKTPKNIRNSLILRTLSPEEGVEVLKNSPMVELNRRKLKTPPTGSRIGSQNFPVAPMPNFDDIDADTDLSKDGSTDRPCEILSSFDTESAMVSSSTSVEPLENDDPPVANSHHVSEPVAGSPGKDVDAVGHFRRMLSSETDRLRQLCLSWKEMLVSDAEQINDEVSGQIRTTIGQAELLMGQRFKQFSGLVDDCEFKTSEKEVTCTDLQGFWDMIYYQVEDVDKKFSDLGKLKSVNWVMESLPLPVKPKAAKKKVAKGTEVGLAAKKKATTRPNFAQFRQKLQQQGQEAESKVIGAILVASPTAEVKTFDGGFFKVDSPAQKKTEANSTEKRRCSLLDVGNTPKATSVARVVLQRMTRKSLIQSIQDSEDQDLTMPSSEINLKNTSPILPDEEQRMISVKRNKPNEKARRSTRRSVYFSEVVTDCDTSDSNFSKYLLPSSDSVASTPDLSCQPKDKSLLAENTPVVNVDVDEVPAKSFKGLKLGFTPGVDGKSRRISSFTPVTNVEKASGMIKINEKSEIISDLMTFSPLASATASNESSGESGRKSQAQRRCSARRSVANKSRMSLL